MPSKMIYLKLSRRFLQKVIPEMIQRIFLLRRISFWIFILIVQVLAIVGLQIGLNCFGWGLNPWNVVLHIHVDTRNVFLAAIYNEATKLIQDTEKPSEITVTYLHPTPQDQLWKIDLQFGTSKERHCRQCMYLRAKRSALIRFNKHFQTLSISFSSSANEAWIVENKFRSENSFSQELFTGCWINERQLEFSLITVNRFVSFSLAPAR